MKNDIDALANRCAVDLHRFESCTDPVHRHCCVVTGPSVHNYHSQVGGCYADSEAAARRYVRDVADLDVRPVQTEIGSVRASVARCCG